MSFIAVSCLPQKHKVQVKSQSAITETSDNNTDDDTNVDENLVEGELKSLEQKENFFQLSGQVALSTLSFFADYKDSFLLRGNNIITTLEQTIKTNQSNFCLVTKFSNTTATNSKNILILSARIRSYYSPILNKVEYFLQIEPTNKVLNQNDCISVGINNKVQTLYNSSAITYSSEEVCPDCKNNINSENLQILNLSAAIVNDIKLDHLYLKIIPALGTPTETVKTCSQNSSCTQIGFNCCLQGQCVNHGEIKPGISTQSSQYKLAAELISTRPELIKNFEDVFYVCPSMVPTETTDPDETPIDPVQTASDLFTELQDLYNCLNPVIDEISICKKEYLNASTLMENGPNLFLANKDDITFSSVNPNLLGNNIAKITYAGGIYYNEKLIETDTQINLNPTYGSFNIKNDDITTEQSVSLEIPKPSGSTNDTLSIYYKIDGSCEKLGTSLARCKKTYIQGQNSPTPRASDHLISNQTFIIPNNYYDSSLNVIVKVGGVSIPKGTDTWTIAGNIVTFNSVTHPIYNNQTVEIEYFASTNITNLMQSKTEAQTKLNSHCKCDAKEKPCNLKPVKTVVNNVEKVTSYVCIYPEVETNIPLQRTVYVSAKSVPHKFYDSSGVNYDLEKIGVDFDQEGIKFEYTDGNNLKPNNMTSYIGFNEIYGSMNTNSAAPLPPTTLNVEKGTTYDLFVDSGAFSTCLTCGTDYYSNLQKVFPNNFNKMGGGYTPDLVESRRFNNQGKFPGDDMKFGRACFVPATMIPWTHVTNSNVQTQRQNRLKSQHFLFANGYNKDWYGFDYGSIIGSFDGVRWFAIGNQRKIRAESNKLYLAVNAYFGDLTINNTFKVTVNEMTSQLNSGSLVLNDLDSDGAECQKAHVCVSDEDCIANLGYEYTCQNVLALKTPWPKFDINGNEISGSVEKSLVSLIGGTAGSPKRCIYRGQGAICEQKSMSVSETNSYTNSTSAALHTCSPNTSCSLVTESKFNTKISRFAQSAKMQNIQTFIPTKSDTFGLASRVLGRPYNFYGTEAAPTGVSAQLVTTKVNGICTPGKDPTNSHLEDANYTITGTAEADKINGVGRTYASTTLSNENYYATCPSTNADGNFTHFLNDNLNSADHKPFAIKNNLSTNALNLPSFSNLNFFNDSQNPVQSIGYHKNTCLRAPGAKCFSDFECAPNSFISSKIKSLISVNGEISSAEKSFWEEDLVCGNSQDRYLANSIYPNPLYKTYQNHCCRETNKSFTFYTQKKDTTDFAAYDTSGEIQIPGVNLEINDPKRYSRIHTTYDKLISDPEKYSKMFLGSGAAEYNLETILLKQYNTLHLNNSRMCCTGHWVREFASGTNGNGGGHAFSGTKQQVFDVRTLRPLSWADNNATPINDFPSPSLPYNCTNEDYQTADCEIKNIPAGSEEETKYLEFFGKLELIGVPQVLIETSKVVYKPLDNNQETIIDPMPADPLPIEKTVKQYGSTTTDFTINGSTEKYYSAASYENFEMGSGKLKKVFSEEKFNCCLPTGVLVDNSTPQSACCTGRHELQDAENNLSACCLPDFTNLSVYTNRYISSEGAKFENQEIRDSDIDPKSGFIKKEIVYEMGKKMCCSGAVAYGRAIGDYFIPVNNGIFNGVKTRRWLYDEDIDNAIGVSGGISKFKAGMKWNHHVYCVPPEVQQEELSLTGGGSGAGSGNENGAVTE